MKWVKKWEKNDFAIVLDSSENVSSVGNIEEVLLLPCLPIMYHVHIFVCLPFFMVSFGCGPSGRQDTTFTVNQGPGKTCELIRGSNDV